MWFERGRSPGAADAIELCMHEPSRRPSEGIEMKVAGSMAIPAVIPAAGRQQVASKAGTPFNGFDLADDAGNRRDL